MKTYTNKQVPVDESIEKKIAYPRKTFHDAFSQKYGVEL